MGSMAYTSAYPITVDGVRLDTLAWGVELRKVVIPGTREANEVVPGVDGVIPSMNDDYDAATYTLDMFVRGSNEDGVVPADSVGRLRANLDHLVAIFSKRHALLDVREVVDAAGTVRQAMMKRQDSFVPEIAPGLSAKFTVQLVIPGVYWRSLSAVDWVGGAGVVNSSQVVTTVEGSTGAINDAVLLVKGPITNPKVADPYGTGAFVQYRGTLAAGDVWRVNCETWATRVGAGLTLDSSDTVGTDATAVTEANDPSGRFLSIRPGYYYGTSVASSTRRSVLMLQGSGASSETQLQVRARKAFI